jgi:ribosomal protein S18 acetylase RimI-like enzyme
MADSTRSRQVIRHGAASDALRLSAIARQTFFDTFAATNDPGDMALHLERAYGVAQQGAELADPLIVSLLAESDGEVIGYAQLREGEVPECVTGPDPIELWRFYVRREWHGRGIAQALMERVRAEAAARGAATLWLGVWDRNPRAQAFYRKCGFVDVGEHVFLFGTDPQCDRVMTAKL